MSRQAPKSSLKSKYDKVKRKQKVRKMRRVVRSAKSRALNAMSVLRQPQSVVMRFQSQACQTYMMTNLFVQAGASSTQLDGNLVFPASGVRVNLNNIMDPWGTGVHCGGFDDVSHQYGKFRVIGSKVVFKVRRMGSSAPFQSGTSAIQPTGGSVAGTSIANNVGTILDVANVDPLLLTSFDRNAWQDMNSMIASTPDEQGLINGRQIINDYVSLQKFKHLKGLQWRELKAGAGQTATLTVKWSEKGLTAAGLNSDVKQINTGLFHNEQGSWTSGGTAPTTVDHVDFDIKEFDSSSPFKHKYSQARVMITATIDYLVKCTEPRYTYSQPS